MPSQEPLYLDCHAKTPLAPEWRRHRLLAGSGLIKWR
jgi:hypothetical protein